MLRLRFSLLAATAALFVVGCSDDYGEPCNLPPSAVVDDFCDSNEGEGESTSATCVFTNSTQCESRMCARYIGSRDFCTIECDIEAENSCPGGSFCQSIPGTSVAFCVPEAILESVE